MSFTKIPVLLWQLFMKELLISSFEVLLLERDEVLLAATRSFHLIFEYLIGHNHPGIRVSRISAWQSARICSLLSLQKSPDLFVFRVLSLNFVTWLVSQEFGILFSRTETWYGREYTEVGDGKWDENPKIRQHLCLASKSGGGLSNHTGGTYSHSGMIQYPRFPDFGIASGKFPDLLGISKLDSQLQNWSMFEISRSSSHHALDRRSWESNVIWRTGDIAIDCGAKRFHRLRYAWCDDCVCTEKTSRQSCSLPQKSKCRRAACSKIRPTLARETNCLHDLRAFPCNRSSWTSTRTLRLAQYTFAELTTSKISTFGGINLYSQQATCLQMWSWKDCTGQNYKTPVQLRTVLALYDQETVRNNGQTRYFTIDDFCKTSYRSDDENSKLQSPKRSCGKRSSHQESKRKGKPTLRCKWESVFSGKHMESVRKETHVVSVMTNIRRLVRWSERKRTIVLSRTKFEGQADEGREQSSKTSGEVEECSSDKRSEFRAVAKIVKQPSCKFWHFVCQNYKSETRCKFGRSCFFKRKLVQKDQLYCWGSLYNWVVYLKILVRESLFHVKTEIWDQDTPSKSPKVPGTKRKIGKERVHREELSKNVLRERCLCAPKFEERSHEETSHQEGCARSVAWDLAKNIYKLKNADKAAFLYSYWCKGNASTHFEKTRGARTRCWVRSINAHGEEKKKKLMWIGYSAKIQELHCGAYSQWRSANKRGSTGSYSWHCNYLKKRLLFLSLGKLCEDHGYSYEWVSGQKPRKGRQSYAKRDNFVPLVVPGSSTSSGSNSSSTSTLQDLSSTSPAQERSDELAPREWCGSHPKTQNKNKKRDGNRDSDERLRDLPEWLEEFTDNLEDTELHAPARISQDSDLERPTKVESKSRKHSIFPNPQKTDIAKSVRGPELQGPLAEDALAKLYFKQKTLVTW